MLKVWLPLNGDLHNQGLDDITVTNNGATVNNSGKIGKCYSFNGNYITISQGYIGDSWSYSLWAYTTSSSSTQCLGCCRTSAGSGFSIFLVGGKLRIDTGGYDLQHTTTYTFPTNTWFHLTITQENGITKYYINGEFKNEYIDNVSSTYWGNIFSIGASQANGSNYGNYLNGRVNDIRIYDHCLSPKEVKELSKGLVLHYPLNHGGFGQDNIIKNSSLRTNYDGWTKSGSLAAPEFTVKDGYECIHFTGKLQKNASYAPCFTTNNTRYLGVQAAGNTYTLSFDVLFENVVKGTTNYYITFYKSGETVNGTWIIPSVVSNSGHMTSATSDILDPSKLNGAGWQTIYLSIRFGDYNWSNANYSFSIYLRDFTGDVYIKNAKVETGLVHTPWIPNPTDDLYSALGLDDGVEYDVSGYGNNGTQIGSLTVDPDTPKYSVSTHFNGSSTIKNTNFLFTNGQWTISFWYKFTTAPSSTYQGFICLSRSDGSDSNKKFAAMPRDSLVWFKFESSSYAMYSRKTNEWCHIAMVCDETKGYIYQNGALIKTIDSVGNILTDCDDLVIGARASSSDAASTTLYLNGNMSDVRIYSTALSADDILALYNTPASIASNGTLLTQGEISEV